MKFEKKNATFASDKSMKQIDLARDNYLTLSREVRERSNTELERERESHLSDGVAKHSQEIFSVTSQA